MRELRETLRRLQEEEAAAWDAAIVAVAQGVRGLGRVLPPEVLVVKTTGREERDHAYTRGNAIMIPASRARTWRGERAMRLLAHELFHVASRAAPAFRDAMYALLGFEPVGPIAPPPELDDKRMSNPDAHALGHYVRLDTGAVVPLLTSGRPLAEVLEETSVLGFASLTLLAINPDDGTVLRDANGALSLVDAQTTDWAARLAKNTAYTIHPEEVLADNLSLVMRRRLGATGTPADPEFLEAFEAILAAHA